MSAVPQNTPSFTEDQVSQLPALHLLLKLGWILVPPEDALRLRGGRRSRVLLRPILEPAEPPGVPDMLLAKLCARRPGLAVCTPALNFR